jgi:hypothetical protein
VPTHEFCCAGCSFNKWLPGVFRSIGVAAECLPAWTSRSKSASSGGQASKRWANRSDLSGTRHEALTITFVGHVGNS